MPYPMPTTISNQEAMNAGLAKLRKRMSVPLMMWSIGSDLRMFWASRKSKIRRVTTSAVNIETHRPTVSATPKPLIGPVPRMISSTDEMSVVRLESKIVPKALS